MGKVFTLCAKRLANKELFTCGLSAFLHFICVMTLLFCDNYIYRWLQAMYFCNCILLTRNAYYTVSKKQH